MHVVILNKKYTCLFVIYLSCIIQEDLVEKEWWLNGNSL